MVKNHVQAAIAWSEGCPGGGLSELGERLIQLDQRLHDLAERDDWQEAMCQELLAAAFDARRTMDNVVGSSVAVCEELDLALRTMGARLYPCSATSARVAVSVARNAVLFAEDSVTPVSELRLADG